MKMKKRIAVVLSLVLMLSCTTAANLEVISAKTKLNKSKLTLYVGKTSKLKVKVFYDIGSYHRRPLSPV